LIHRRAETAKVDIFRGMVFVPVGTLGVAACGGEITDRGATGVGGGASAGGSTSTGSAAGVPPAASGGAAAALGGVAGTGTGHQATASGGTAGATTSAGAPGSDTTSDPLNCGASGTACAPVVLTAPVPEWSGLAVDAAFAYWTDVFDGIVMKVPLDGGARTTLASGHGAGPMTVDATSVYWTTELSGPSVMKVPLGGEPRIVPKLDRLRIKRPRDDST
jgi:hypothetical protein